MIESPLLLHDFGERLMIPGVIAYFVTLRYHTLEDFRVGLDHLSDHEEGGVDVTLLQDIEKLWRVGGILTVGSRTVIEGHRNVGAIDLHGADTTPSW
jgi:hypothetical protein